MVRKTGSEVRKSLRSISRIWVTIIAPTTTRAAAPASIGMTPMSGAKNIESRKSTPVTHAARPVLAPSAMPAAESTKTVFDEAEAPPPATAPRPSTMKAPRMRGNIPSSVCRPALRARPVIVPIASKKFVNTRVKTSIVAASTPMRSKDPKRSKAPMSEKSGRATTWLGSCGALRFQPGGRG